MERKIKFGIFPRLLLMVIIVAIIPLGTNWYVNYQASIGRLQTQIEQELSTESDAIVAYIDAWMDMNLKMLRQNAALGSISSMNPKRQIPVLKSIANEYKWLSLLHTMGPDGIDVARNDDVAPINYQDRIYFQEAMKGAPFSSQVLISRTTGKPSISFSVPIFDRQKKVVGVLALAMPIADLSDAITKVKTGKTGYVYLLDKKGSVVAHQKKEFTKVLANFNNHPTFSQLGEMKKKKISFKDGINNKQTIAYSQKTKRGWILVVQQDYDEAYALILEANRNALVVLAGTLIFVILVSFGLARFMSRPILNLAHIADCMSRGELNASIKEVSRTDEIGALARSISRLSKSMKSAIEQLSR